MLRGRRRKHWMRTFYMLSSARRLRSSLTSESPDDYWQAGMSVAGIRSIVPAAEVVRNFAHALRATDRP
jgi:hypothetical protein